MKSLQTQLEGIGEDIAERMERVSKMVTKAETEVMG